MEYIKKEELIKGEVYRHENGNLVQYLFDSNDTQIHGHFIGDERNEFKNYNNLISKFTINKLKLATSEEKHWLNCCITADKFITFEEAMKTFVPEYVECINTSSSSAYTLNKVYKIINKTKFPKILNILGDNDVEYNIVKWDKSFIEKNHNCFKPSTKEAYDAQFVVKEPKFVLPEIWHVIVTEENQEILTKYGEFNNNYSLPIGYLIGMTKRNDGKISKGHNPGDSIKRVGVYPSTGFDFGNEITFEQFKKYVLKEEIVEEKVIEPLPQFKVIETIETITKVENNEGNQFFIGDNIKSSNNIISKIESFEYNQDKSKILAYVINLTRNDYFDINEIEHYIEPKIVKPEFILPERWKVLRNHENYKIINDYFKNRYPNNTPPELPTGYIGIEENSWKSCGFLNESVITFDQFKKYILKSDEINDNKLPIIGLNLAQESLLDKAKRLYPVGTKFKNAYSNDECIIKKGNFFEGNNDNIYHSVSRDIALYQDGCSGCVYFRNKWAEVIEYPHNFKIGDKIKIRSTGDSNIYEIINIEGNVLFYKFQSGFTSIQCRVLAKNAIKVD